MASQATRYALTTIAFAHGIGNVLARDAKNHLAKNVAQNMADTAHQSMRLWPGDVSFSRSDVATMQRRIAKIESLGFEADVLHTLEAISMLSEILVSIHKKLKGPVKRQLITDVIDALAKLHRFHAPAEDGPREMKLYERGAQLAEIFNELRG